MVQAFDAVVLVPLSSGLTGSQIFELWIFRALKFSSFSLCLQSKLYKSQPPSPSLQAYNANYLEFGDILNFLNSTIC